MSPSDRTVFVIDDDEAVRKGLTFLLRAAEHRVETFSSAVDFLKTYSGPRGGCLVLDIRMPEMTGLELQNEINARGWHIPTIFITGHGTIPIAIAAMKAGAFDFIEKPLRGDALLETLEQAFNQDQAQRRERLELANLNARAAILTGREREILKLVATGESNKLIARQLGISFRTVELHRSHILEKLGARTLAELIRMAILLDQQRT